MFMGHCAAATSFPVATPQYLITKVAKGGGVVDDDPVLCTNFNKIHVSRTVLTKFHESGNSTKKLILSGF